LKCKKHNRQARRFRCNSVPCIITPPLFGKLLVGAEPAAARQESCPQDDEKSQMTNCADTSFTQPLRQGLGLLFVYTKLSACPSSKISRVIYAFLRH